VGEDRARSQAEYREDGFVLGGLRVLCGSLKYEDDSGVRVVSRLREAWGDIRVFCGTIEGEFVVSAEESLVPVGEGDGDRLSGANAVNTALDSKQPPGVD